MTLDALPLVGPSLDDVDGLRDERQMSETREDGSAVETRSGNFLATKTHAPSSTEMSSSPLNTRDNDIGLDSIHSTCEVESVWKGQDSSNDSRSRASDASEDDEPHNLSPLGTEVNEALEILPQATVTPSQRSSVELNPVLEADEVRRQLWGFSHTIDSPLQQAHNLRQTSLEAHDRTRYEDPPSPFQNSVIPTAPLESRRLSEPRTANSHGPPQRTSAVILDIATRWNSGDPDNVFGGWLSVARSVRGNTDSDGSSQSSNYDGEELYEQFEIEGVSKEEFRTWVKHAPPEDLEIARAEALKGAQAEKLEGFTELHPSEQVSHGRLTSVPDDSASMQLQQENETSQLHTPNRKGDTFTSRHSADDWKLSDSAGSTILPTSERTLANNIQNLPQHLVLSLMRSQVDFYVKGHPFYRSPHIPHTITERRDFTRDVYDYSRARGLTTAQSHVEVKKAAKSYRKCRRLAKVLQWIDIARDQARSMEDELQRIRDEEGWDTDDIEGNFSNDDSDAGTNLGTEIDDSTELLNEATKMIQSVAEDRGFLPTMYSGSNEKRAHPKQLKGKLKRSLTKSETADGVARQLEIHAGGERVGGAKKLKITSTEQRDQLGSYKLASRGREKAEPGGAAHQKKVRDDPSTALGDNDTDGIRGDPAAPKTPGGTLSVNGGNHEARSIKGDYQKTLTMKRNVPSDATKPMEVIGHENLLKNAKTKPKKQCGSEDNEKRLLARTEDRRRSPLKASPPLDTGDSRDLKRSHKNFKRGRSSGPVAMVPRPPLPELTPATHDNGYGSEKRPWEKKIAEGDEDATDQQLGKQTLQPDTENSKSHRRKGKRQQASHIPGEGVENIPATEPGQKSAKKSRKRKSSKGHRKEHTPTEKLAPGFLNPDESLSKAGDEGVVPNTASGVFTNISNSIRDAAYTPGPRDGEETSQIERNVQLAGSNSNLTPNIQCSKSMANVEGPTVTPPGTPLGRQKASLRSPYFEPPSATGPPKRVRKSSSAVSITPFPPLSSPVFGLIQEKLAHDPFKLLIGATLLNRTKGVHAIPVIFYLIEKYPAPEDMAGADEKELAQATRHLGMQNIRAKRYIELAKAWLADPPRKGYRHRKLHYPRRDDGKDIKPHETISDDDPRVGAWEIAHLPTTGPYALDSWRIFHRDKFRGLTSDWTGLGACSKDFEPEWKRVVPKDKELRAYLRWMWLKEGWEWDPLTGNKVAASEELMEKAMKGDVVWEELGDEKEEKQDEG